MVANVGERERDTYTKGKEKEAKVPKEKVNVQMQKLDSGLLVTVQTRTQRLTYGPTFSWLFFSLYFTSISLFTGLSLSLSLSLQLSFSFVNFAIHWSLCVCSDFCMPMYVCVT